MSSAVIMNRHRLGICCNKPHIHDLWRQNEFVSQLHSSTEQGISRL